MPRLMTEMLEEEGPEDEVVIPDGVLEDESPGYEALLRPSSPEAPRLPSVMGPGAKVVAGGSAKVEPSFKEMLRKAQRGDAKQAADDAASDALYAAFARRPIQKLSSTPSKADALLKQQAFERQGKHDDQTAELNKAKIANYLKSKTEKGPADLGDRTVVEKMLNLEPGSLANVSDKTLQRITGLRIAGDNRAAAEARFHEGRAFTADQNDQTRRAMREEREYQHEMHKEDKLEKKVEGLGKDLEGTASVKRAIEDIDAAIARNPSDIPGQGYWDSRKPEWFDSSDDAIVKQNLKQMVAKILKKQSGQGVTEAEYNRTLQSYGITPNSTAATFKVGWGAMKADAVKAAAESEARYGRDAAERYRQRGGITSSDFGRASVPLGMSLDEKPDLDTSIPVREPGQTAPDDGYEYRTNPKTGKMQRRKKGQ